jgi:hypothetical protein
MGRPANAPVADRSRKLRAYVDLKLLGEVTATHSNARARHPGAPHARAVSAMEGISSSAAEAALLAPPPEPPATGDHGGAADHDDDDDDHHENDNHTFSPLVDLLDRFRDLFALKVLVHLDPIDRTFLVQTGGACRAAVAASNLPRAGGRETVLGRRVWVVTHRLTEFCTSVERVAWALNNGCPWVAHTCALAARVGRVGVLRWARDNDCPWDARTCEAAARGGHLEVLRWAREHHCPWNAGTCRAAAAHGHLGVLRWARANDCPWSKGECAYVSRHHPETQAWVWAQPE